MLWVVKDSVDFLNDTGLYIEIVETSNGDILSHGFGWGTGRYMNKRNQYGEILWSIPYNDFSVVSMQNTQDGNIILAGAVNNCDIALRKIDSDGYTIWTSFFDLGSFSVAWSVKETTAGDFILTGVYETDSLDLIIIKTDSNGDSLWTRLYSDFEVTDRGTCIQ